MNLQISDTSTGLEPPPKAFIEYGTPPDLSPSDDKMVEVWLALHAGGEFGHMGGIVQKPFRADKEQELYDLLTKSLIERAKNYGSLERP
jgi:hypothetical protein